MCLLQAVPRGHRPHPLTPAHCSIRNDRRLTLTLTPTLAMALTLNLTVFLGKGWVVSLPPIMVMTLLTEWVEFLLACGVMYVDNYLMPMMLMM